MRTALAEHVERVVHTSGVATLDPSAPLEPPDVRPAPPGAIMAAAMNRSTPASVDAGLNMVHVDDVPAGHGLALEPCRIGERYLPGSEHPTFRGILSGIAGIAAGRAPTFRIRHALPTFPSCRNESVTRVAERGTPRVGVDTVRMSKPGTFFTCEKVRNEPGLAPQPATEAVRDAIH